MAPPPPCTTSRTHATSNQPARPSNRFSRPSLYLIEHQRIREGDQPAVANSSMRFMIGRICLPDRATSPHRTSTYIAVVLHDDTGRRDTRHNHVSAHRSLGVPTIAYFRPHAHWPPRCDSMHTAICMAFSLEDCMNCHSVELTVQGCLTGTHRL